MDDWKFLVGGAVGLMAIIRLAEWFVKGQLARSRIKNGNGNESSCPFSGKDLACKFTAEDSRRLFDAGGNCFKILEIITQIYKWHDKTDTDGRFIWYQDPDVEKAMNGVIENLKTLTASINGVNDNIQKTGQALDKITLVQDRLLSSHNRIETKVDSLK